MNYFSDKNQQARFTPGQLTNLLVASLLLIVATFLYLNSETRFRDFVDSQQQLMQKSATDTVQVLDVYIRQTSSIVQLFARSENAMLAQLSETPEDSDLLEQFRNRLQLSIPDHFSFTIADATGEPILDDFDGRIGDVCLVGIRNFSQVGHVGTLVIHPNPAQYHFDIMVKTSLSGVKGVFFVSFKPDILADLLAASEIGSHQMMLLNKNRPSLIELTSDGSRDILQRDFDLDSTELDSITIRRDVPGTEWELIYLPDTQLFADKLQDFRLQAIQGFLIFFIFSAIMLLLIRREEGRRLKAEALLQESHDLLESRVDERTEELQQANRQLKEEIDFRIETETKLSDSERRYELASRGAHDGIWEWEIASNNLHFSLRWLEMMGEDRFGDENHLEDWFEKINEEDRSKVAHDFKQARLGISDEIDVEFRMSDKNGQMRWYLCHAASEKDDNGDVVRIAGSQTDIHDHKLAAQQLQHDALHDMLTGLPNRYVFMDRLGQAVHTRSRDKDYLYAVMFIDLDRFKNVNDSLGHSAGDELLKGVARRVSACLRPGDTLARLGGDEFVILVNDFKHVSDVTGLAERINEAVAVPIEIHGHELIINASIGIALGSDDYTNPAHLLRDSDIAMYRAKNTGTGKHYIYNESIRQDTMERLKTETELRKSVADNQLMVYYQPIIELSSGSIYGLEALLRWDHPDRGVIQPDDFIPLAEQTGLIVPIGAWVMEVSCEQVKKWKEAYPEYGALALSVNLSCKQFLQNNLAETIREILQRTQIDKADFLLNLEITETVVMQNASCSTDILQDLKALGIRLAVDDFGTGYSSLAYLQRFPIDILKIDKQFVSMIDRDEDSRAIVKTVIELAENLNLHVVAEGIESAEQLEILREMGCHYGQGFFISRPVSAFQLEEILKSPPHWL